MTAPSGPFPSSSTPTVRVVEQETPATEDSLRLCVREVRQRMADACSRAGRAPSDVTLVAATKMHLSSTLRAAHAVGLRAFGENYASELRDKRAALADLVDVQWHYIGRVQRGNANIIAQADLVHGVGSLSQAEALDKAARRRIAPLPVLLQVNLVHEESKNGFHESGLIAALPALRALPHLTLRGLMAMPDVDDVRRAFADVRALRDRVCPDLRELSMGMSGDYVEAIEEGATIVRIGTALFGARPPAAPPEERPHTHTLDTGTGVTTETT